MTRHEASNAIYRTPDQEVLGEPNSPNASALLHCGWCGHEYTGLLAPVVHLAGDDYDPDSPLQNRGAWVEIPVECEECARVTVLVLGFHKGYTLMNVLTRSERREHISRATGTQPAEASPDA
jgi:hypothetical protein